jgi:hypothetical protein
MVKTFSSANGWINRTVIAQGYGLDDLGSRDRFLAGARNFSLQHRAQNGSGAHQPPIQWAPGALSLGVKRPRREADHPPPSSAEVKNAWSYTSTPQYVFMAWCLVKHKGNRTNWAPLQHVSEELCFR